jgi:hypothetical protein
MVGFKSLLDNHQSVLLARILTALSYVYHDSREVLFVGHMNNEICYICSLTDSATQ